MEVILSNRIDKLHNTSTDIMKKKSILDTTNKSLEFDADLTKEIIGGLISDTSDMASIEQHSAVLQSEQSRVSSELDDVNSQREDTIAEINSYKSGLESNADKLEQMNQISDLVSTDKQQSDTHKRIAELIALKELLEDESDTSSENTDYQISDISADSKTVEYRDPILELLSEFKQVSTAKTLNRNELEYVINNVFSHYENGKHIANFVAFFNSYKEHHLIENGHIGKVRDHSIQAAGILSKWFAKNNYNGKYAPVNDLRTLEVMALYHDTGMDGNLDANMDAATWNKLKSDYETNHSGKSFDKKMRADHSLESAIHVLRDRSKIESMGINADEVALGCLLHPKNNSGAPNLADLKHWDIAINKLQARVNSYNSEHPDVKPITFSDTFLRNVNGGFDEKKSARFRTECLLLRIGDAFGHDCNSHTSQNGKLIDFNLDNYNPPPITEKDILNRWSEESKCADVTIGGVKITDNNDPDGKQRTYAVGEGNIKRMYMQESADGHPEAVFEILNSNSFPYCTMYAVLECVGEINTAKLTEDPYVKE